MGDWSWILNAETNRWSSLSLTACAGTCELSFVLCLILMSVNITNLMQECAGNLVNC
jgi:hypothetical protein